MTDVDAARESVDALIAAGDWPEPVLLENVLAHGEAAIEPLLGVFRQRLADKNDDSALQHALYLLGMLRAREALPDLLSLFRTFDNDILEDAAKVVGSFGHEVIEPLLVIIGDRELAWYPRSAAVNAARFAAGDDLAARQRIAEVLREQLQERLSRNEEPTSDDYETISLLVSDLADLADPLARDLINQAFDADLVDEFMVDRASVDRSYEEGGEIANTPEPPNWLDDYRQLRDEHLAWEARRSTYESFPVRSFDPDSLRSSSDDEPPAPPVETIRLTRKRPGRNDPCWCGSGKKYKKCHMRQDDETGSRP